MPFLALVAIATIAELLVVKFEFRRQGVSISLREVAEIVGLACSGPFVLLGAGLLSLIPFFPRWRSSAKVTFNCARRALELGVSRAILGLLAPHQSLLTPSGAAIVVLAIVAGHVVYVAAMTLVIRATAGPAAAQGMWPVHLLSSGFVLCNTTLGLLAIVMLSTQAWAVSLLVLIGLAMGVGYRAYATLRQRYANLRLLYGFSAALATAHTNDDVMRLILEQSAEMLNAEHVALILPAAAGYVEVTFDGSGPVTRRLEQPDEVSTQVFASSRGIVVARNAPGRTARSLRDRPRGSGRAMRDAAGFKDVIAVPVATDADDFGVLLVADRASNIKTFDSEEKRLLEALAAHASVALRNGQLVDRLTTEAATRAHQALHDALTGLGNRTLFSERLQVALEEQSGFIIAVMLMDLDEFKEINDTLGHHTGDAVLREVANRLNHTVAQHGTVARLGGDEFAVFLPACPSVEHAISFAELLRQAIDEPIEVDNLVLEVRGSIGLAMSPQHGDDPATLLQRADVAMYGAKGSRLGVEVYDPTRDHYSHRRLALSTDLRHAISAGQLYLAYQPKVMLADGRIAGMEALLRWNHPTYGSIPPDEFIPVAEQSGLIGPLTRWVLGVALRQLAVFRRHELDLSIAVNLSPRSLLDTTMIDDVERALYQTGVPPGALTIELTETSVMADPARSEAMLGQLAELGCRLSIDDFGTGYSSLSRLKHLPVNEVKIDKSFVMQMTVDADDAVIVRSIVDLARNLGLKVVAEGVEDLDTLMALRSLGCDQIQGYYISKPVPAEALAAWLPSQRVGRLPQLRTKTAGGMSGVESVSA